jgi:hypothetical protein
MFIYTTLHTICPIINFGIFIQMTFLWIRRRRTAATPTTTTTTPDDDDDDAVFGEARDRETNDDDHQSARHRAGDDERYVHTERNAQFDDDWIQSASTRGRRGQSWQDADV